MPPTAIPGFGPACLPELRACGIYSVAHIRELGWEAAYLRWVGRFPARVNVNAACAMLAAEQGISWQQVDPADKERVRRLVRRLRASGKQVL